MQQASNFEMVIKLIDLIIWPVTLLVIVLIFRRNFSNAFERLGSIKADASGLAINFEKKLEETKQLFDKIKPKNISKAGVGIKTYVNQNDSPYKEVLDIRSDIINYLRLKSETAGLDADTLSPQELTNRLLNLNKLDENQAKMISAMLDLTNNADANTTKQQAESINNLFKQIEIEK